MTDAEATKRAAKATAPKFDPGMPEMVREFTEKSVQQAKDNYARFKAAAEDTTDRLEETYASASKGAAEFNLKTLEAVRINVNAGFDFAREMLGAKSFSEALELSASHLRQQFENLSAQAKDLSAIAQKVTAEASEPIKTGMNKTFKMQ